MKENLVPNNEFTNQVSEFFKPDPDVIYSSLYKHIMNKINNHELWKDHMGNISEPLFYEEDIEKGMDTYRTIVLKINKELDFNEFRIYRSFLLGLLNQIDDRINWRICFSNQLYKPFQNYFEIHPEIKDLT